MPLLGYKNHAIACRWDIIFCYMPERPITPHRPIDEIFTGDFDMGPAYFSWRPAGTTDCLLIYTVAGRGRFSTRGGAVVESAEGDFVLLPPGSLHDYGTAPTSARWKLLWAHFHPRPDWSTLLDWPEPEEGLFRLRTNEAASRQALNAQFALVHESALSTGPLRTRLAMNALERLLLLCAPYNPGQTQSPVDPRIRGVMDHVAKHLQESLDLESLADRCGLSVSRFGHLFKEAVGCSPVEYIERTRVNRARELLRMTPLSVKEIARQVGYSSQFYLSLRFKKRVGVSPSAYREGKQRDN